MCFKYLLIVSSLDYIDDDNSAVKGPVKLDNFRPTGSALGPDWSEGLAIQGHVENKVGPPRCISHLTFQYLFN